MQNDDQQFFKQAMSDVEPLEKTKSENQNPKSRKPAQKSHKVYFHKAPVTVALKAPSAPPEPASKYTFYDNEFFPFAAEETLNFSRAGFSNQKELRAGKWPVQATLDLHGNTVDEARDKTARFLAKSLQQQYRCVKIIHGKGRSEQPILKNKVAQWLPQCEDVLAFCSAAPNDGGSGAVYVLLKKP